MVGTIDSAPHFQGDVAGILGTSSPGCRTADVKSMFGTTVDFIADNRIVFDIGGNKYRLIVRVSYEYRQVLIKFVGTHAEYDRIDARSV